jgi:hypothetical protein
MHLFLLSADISMENQVEKILPAVALHDHIYPRAQGSSLPNVPVATRPASGLISASTQFAENDERPTRAEKVTLLSLVVQLSDTRRPKR